MVELIQKNAELVRSVAREQLSTEVNYDRAGVEWLDGFLTRQHEQGDEGRLDGLMSTLGSFFGECIRDVYGGTWSQDDYGWCIRFDEKNAAYPFAKIEKHLRNGSDDSVLGLFDSIPLVFNLGQFPPALNETDFPDTRSDRRCPWGCLPFPAGRRSR